MLTARAPAPTPRRPNVPHGSPTEIAAQRADTRGLAGPVMREAASALGPNPTRHPTRLRRLHRPRARGSALRYDRAAAWTRRPYPAVAGYGLRRSHVGLATRTIVITPGTARRASAFGCGCPSGQGRAQPVVQGRRVRPGQRRRWGRPKRPREMEDGHGAKDGQPSADHTRRPATAVARAPVPTARTDTPRLIGLRRHPRLRRGRRVGDHHSWLPTVMTLAQSGALLAAPRGPRRWCWLSIATLAAAGVRMDCSRRTGSTPSPATAASC